MVKIVKQASNWWWFDSHNNTRRTPWLQSTLADLDLKTEAMLKLIEHDADSFAQRAEMYYKKRPELISMVEDFYRTHRLLAEKYDQLKSESGSRLISTLGSPFLSTKHQPEKLTSKTDQNYESTLESPFLSTKHQPGKLTSKMDQNYETNSETSDLEDCALSEVDNPEEEEAIQLENEPKSEEEESWEADMIEEIRKLREEVERLKEEKRVQTEQLLQKDEEKMEVIRQLSFTVDLLKEENLRLRKNCLQMAREPPKKRNNPFELSHLKSTFLGKLFNLSPAVIAL